VNTKQFSLVLVTVFIAGLLGGVAASMLFPRPSRTAKVLKAERFEVVDQDGKPRALLGVLGSGEPGLQLYDRDENGRVDLSLKASGRPGLELSDSNGRVRAALGYTEIVRPETGEIERRQVSSIVLFDQDGKVLWQTP
jgi:hypothetical protein